MTDIERARVRRDDARIRRAIRELASQMGGRETEAVIDLGDPGLLAKLRDEIDAEEPEGGA